MMSEEITGSDDCYTRHRPTWRSATFNAFIDKLDQRSTKKASLARTRRNGKGIERIPPKGTKSWMLQERRRESDVPSDQGQSGDSDREDEYLRDMIDQSQSARSD